MLKKGIRLPVLLGGLGLAGALLAYWLILEFSGVPGHMNRFYPINTGFYLELAPGDTLMRRFIAFLEKQTLPEKTGKKPDASEEVHRALLKQFTSTFESRFSIGAWPESPAGKKAQVDHPALIVLPLRESLNLDDLIRRFHWQPEDFLSSSYRQTPYMEVKNSGAAMAILDRKLLIANSVEALRSTLDHYERHAPDVFQSADNKPCLARLPWFRQGTFILNNSVYNRAKNRPGLPFGNVGKLFPLVAGSVQARWDRILSVRFVMPVALADIPDKAFRTEFRRLLEARDDFPQVDKLPSDTAAMIAVTDLDRDFSFYRHFLMPPEQTRWINMADMLLRGFNVDFENDLIGLLRKRTILSARTGRRPSLIAVLDKNERKDSSLDKMSRLLSTNAFPVHLESGAHPAKAGGHAAENGGMTAARTLLLPISDNQGSVRMSFGTIGDFLVFASPGDYRHMLKIARGQAENLSQTARYQAIRQDMPGKSNIQGYINVADQARFVTVPPGMENPALWLDAIGFSLWGEPESSSRDSRIMLNGQMNVRLVE